MNGRSGDSVQPVARRPRRWLVAVAVLALLGVAVVIALPHAVGYGIRRGLMAAGAGPVTLDDVDLNPFTGRLVLRGLVVGAGDGPPLVLERALVDVSWRALPRRRVLVERLEVSGLDLLAEVAGGVATVGGIAPPPPDAGPVPDAGSPAEPVPPSASAVATPWGIGVASLTVTDSAIRYRVPQREGVVAISRLALAGLYSWAPDDPGSLALDATADGADLELEARVTPFAAAPGANGQVALAGLELAPLLPFTAGGLAELAGRLDVDLAFQAAQAGLGTLQLTADGGVTLGGLRVVTADGVASLAELAWNGQAAFATEPGAPPTVRASGSLSLSGMAATDGAGGVTLAAADTVRLEGVAVDGPADAAVATLTVNGLALLRAGADAEPLFRAGAVTVTEVALRPADRLTVASVEVADAWAVVRRLPDGTLHPLNALPRRAAAASGDTSAVPAGAADGAPPAAGAAPFTFALGRLAVTGDSGVRFDDQGVTPAYRLRAAIREMRVAGLDSAAPEQPSPVALRVDLGEFATVTLAGTVAPLAERLNMALTGQITSLELPPLSPYSAAATGYNVGSGALDADLRLTITDGALDGETVLRLRQLTLAAASKERAERLTRELTMPVEAALSLLRDKRDNIKLTVPLSGSVDDPRFDLNQVINKALAGATRKAALSYLKFALAPYGTLISVAQMAAGAAGAIGLDPVAFQAGDGAPPADVDAYLQKVAGLLADRSGLSLKVCGRAVAADRLALPARQAPDVATDPEAVAARVAAAAKGEAVPPEPATDQELLDLARARADAVKGRLVTGLGVAPERVFVCNPEIDPQAAARPRVELRI